MSGVPTGCSDVPSGRNMGCPTRREPHGYGAVIVVRPGEGPGQGEGPQDGRKPAGRRARCTKAKTARLPAAIRRKSIWKATCMENVHAWFGEGRMKKGRVIGTSSAAYSTALPHHDVSRHNLYFSKRGVSPRSGQEPSYWTNNTCPVRFSCRFFVGIGRSYSIGGDCCAKSSW